MKIKRFIYMITICMGSFVAIVSINTSSVSAVDIASSSKTTLSTDESNIKDKGLRGNWTIDDALVYIGKNPSDYKETKTGNRQITLLGIAESFQNVYDEQNGRLITDDAITTYLILHDNYGTFHSGTYAIDMSLNGVEYTLGRSKVDTLSKMIYQTTEMSSAIQKSRGINNVSSGILIIGFRHFKISQNVERRYAFEKFLYDFTGALNDEYYFEKSANLGFYMSFMADGTPINGGYDGFSDVYYRVNRKSVVCTEIKFSVKRTKQLLIDGTSVYIIMQDKLTGEVIKNAKVLQATYKIKGETYGGKFDLQNNPFGGLSLSKKGTFSKPNEADIKICENEFFFTPTYIWYWNWYVDEIMTMYVWYEVEPGTIIQGSFYENGLHVEYDVDGSIDGVYDFQGNKINGYGADRYGRIVDSKTGELTPIKGMTAEYPEPEDPKEPEQPKETIKIPNYIILGGIGLIVGGIVWYKKKKK